MNPVTHYIMVQYHVKSVCLISFYSSSQLSSALMFVNHIHQVHQRYAAHVYETGLTSVMVRE